MSSDGNSIVVGAPYNDGNGSNSGHVRVYDWNGSGWVKRGSDLDGDAAGDRFGNSVALSSNKNSLIIGSRLHDNVRGHVKIFHWNGTAWVQRGSDIDGEQTLGSSGETVAMSNDGDTIAIGAPTNNGASGTDSGHVRVFDWNGTAWIQRGSDIDGENAWDSSGVSLSMSANGNTISVGSLSNDDNGTNSGHVRVYDWNGSGWIQRGSDIDGDQQGDIAGDVSISDDGDTIAIGASGHASASGNNA
jgi:hypothetical protein